MRLNNLLQMAGGIHEQGREITFRLRYTGKDGVPQVRDVTGVLFPLSEEEMQKAQEEADDPKGRTLPAGEEFVIRMLAVNLRDPSDLSKRLIEDPRDMALLRAGLVAPQYAWLLAEYRQLIEQEYPDVVTDKDAADLESQARVFSKGDQPGPG